MSAPGRVVRSGVGRRRVPGIVIGLATLMAVAASLLGGTLVVASGAPFDDAFARQRGAHLSLQFDADAGGPGQLSGTVHAEGVAAASGPFRTATVTPHAGEGVPAWPMTVAGRARPGGAVDAVTLTDGKWAARPGEVVLSAGSAVLPILGKRLTFPGLPGEPELTVVGVARSVTGTADAWVVPAQMAALTAPGGAGGYQMHYRFTEAGTAARITAGREAVTAAVPPGAVSGEQSWLTVKESAEHDTALYVPFLLAFGVLGLVMSVLVVGNVVAATVGTATRRIGILKAVGFTPAQVVRAYVAQALVPAAAGTALGVLTGHLLAVPVLAETEEVYGSTALAVTPWIDAVVVAGALGLVAATAWASAWRAGRLRTVDALAVGRAARPARGRRAARLAGRLPLPRPVGLGLVRPFARPARALATGTAIVFGAAAVTFTVGLGATLGKVMEAKAHDAADVTVEPPPPELGPDGPLPRTGPLADPAEIAAVIDARPGTARHHARATARATVAGVAGVTEVVSFTGDASWGGYTMSDGRWIARPGEAVVPTGFLSATGTRIGDPVTLHGLGDAVTVRIVGEVLDTRNDGMEVFTDAATLPDAAPEASASSVAGDTTHHIALEPGTDAAAYAAALNEKLEPLGVTARAGGDDRQSSMVLTLNALSATLTLMLVAVAALGVLNGVVLDTRERVRELGIHKALGMTPRQTVAMVLASICVTGLVGGAVGVPLGVTLHGLVVPAMGHSAGLNLPESVTDVYLAPQLLGLALGGLVIAAAGALLPAGWAARTRTAVALRTE
ncbi:ABC transporter permease [Streptomyces abyssomicinicus]|uniref:ABC transporter permease n=1 Tax=Streptomyces abyssomicinicus TaxID=574929 RepID=UPI0013E0C5D2|nr:FtsX-like permease family protein [Streptomyces abyssomicinicus]